jgi:signal transduction histidine kinase/ActR/RegA family two-component response regulator
MQILGLCFNGAVAGVDTHHEGALVAVAYLTAALASFTALDMAERLHHAAATARRFWLWGSALVLGGGIWSMHFIAMLAFRAPMHIAYDAGGTVISGAVAVLGVAAGLAVLGRGGLRRILGGGLLVGLSIAAMHYMGMGAMRLPGEVYYRPGLFALSVLIAVAAASVALWLTTALQNMWQRAAAALVMAVAICGMHFTGMAGAAIVPSPAVAFEQAAGLLSGALLAWAIAVSLGLMLLLALLCAYFDRRMEARDASEAERLRALNESLEAKVQQRTGELTSALEALDEQRLRAEAANRFKSDFLANMSHELRTPLNAIIGFADVLKLQRGEEALKPSQMEAVQQIGASGRHLLSLIEEVLDFSKIEAGKITVTLEPVDPTQIAGDLATTFRFDLEKAGVGLEIAAPPQPIAVSADLLRLKQVLTNLISNAIKYNRPGGGVCVEVADLAQEVAIRVRDNGLGIPADRLPNLFEPFNRLGRETSTVDGAGLGLALTKRLVTAMGGELAVESEAGVGSTFTVRLPAAAPAQARPEPAIEPATPIEGPAATILYIEDNPSNVRLMHHVAMALGGLDLHVAEHPLEGLAMAARLRPDLILLDINLPDMDGFQVKARLDADPATREIPVVALSANVLSDTKARGRNAGFFGFLAKPLSIPALAETIHAAVAHRDAGAEAQRLSA